MEERIKILNDKIAKNKSGLQLIVQEIQKSQNKTNGLNTQGIKKQGVIEEYEKELENLKIAINKSSGDEVVVK